MAYTTTLDRMKEVERYMKEMNDPYIELYYSGTESLFICNIKSTGGSLVTRVAGDTIYKAVRKMYTSNKWRDAK